MIVATTEYSEVKWDGITMDFMTALSKTQRMFDAIWVMLYILTKSTHFIHINHIYNMEYNLSQVYIKEIVRLQRILQIWYVVKTPDPHWDFGSNWIKNIGQN